MVHECDTVSSRAFRQANLNDRRRCGQRGRLSTAGPSDHLILSPAGLIKTLANTLHGEMAELYFYCFLLHDKCWRIIMDFKRIVEA